MPRIHPTKFKIIASLITTDRRELVTQRSDKYLYRNLHANKLGNAEFSVKLRLQLSVQNFELETIMAK